MKLKEISIQVPYGKLLIGLSRIEIQLLTTDIGEPNLLLIGLSRIEILTLVKRLRKSAAINWTK